MFGIMFPWILTRKVNLFRLMGLDTLDRFYTFFYNKDNLWDALFSFLHIKSFLKKV